MEDLMLWLIGAAIAAILGVTVWTVWRSPTFELRKADWTCAESHRETFTTYMMVGKVLVPQIHTEDVCTNWVRR